MSGRNSRGELQNGNSPLLQSHGAMKLLDMERTIGKAACACAEILDIEAVYSVLGDFKEIFVILRFYSLSFQSDTVFHRTDLKKTLIIGVKRDGYLISGCERITVRIFRMQ